MAIILVIDDEAAMRRVLRGMLGPDHDVIEAEDGSVGLDRFMEHAPDLVITDIVMPGKEGIETILEMRRHAPHAKILAISGAAMPRSAHYLEMAGKLGADIRLTKPIMATDLHEAVRSLLGAASVGSCAP